MNRTVLSIVAVAILGAAAGAWVGTRMSPQRFAAIAEPAAQRGDRFVDATLPDLDGHQRRVADFTGRPLVINFWAAWCSPCVRELPMLDAYEREQGGAGVRILTIAQDDPGAVADMVERLGLKLPVLLDEPGPLDLSVRYGNARNVLPFSVLIDADGAIVAQHAGSFDRESFHRWLAPIR